VILVNDSRLSDDYLVDDLNRLSQLAVPLLDNGNLVGVIYSEHHELNYFTESHVKTLVALAFITATKISQNRSLNKLQQTVEQLEHGSKIQDALFDIA
jgi:GAF domain-containing protein